MANILGEGFPQFVIDQVDTRQKVYGSTNRTPQELTYLSNRTAFIRLLSSVDITNNKKLKKICLSDSYLGPKLAQEFVLFAGVSNTGNGESSNISHLRSGINQNSTSLLSNNAYGIGGNEFGLQPMPTMRNVEVKYKNRGSLRESNLTITCYNHSQFQIIELLYLRLGYSVLLEWGNVCYFNNKNEFVSNNTTSLQEYFLQKDASSKITHIDVLKEILKKREESNGNYDAFLGKVSNYSWTFENGVYNISLKLISLGDIIESLNINYLTAKAKLNLSSDTDAENNGVESTSEKVKEDDTDLDLVNKFYKSSNLGFLFYAGNFFSKSGNGTVPEGGNNKFSYSSLSKVWKSKVKIPFGKLQKEDQSIIDIKDSDKSFLTINFGDEWDDIPYIRFGALLEFLEKSEMLYVGDTFPSNEKSNLVQPLLKIDYDPDTNFCITNKGILSTDPRICVVNGGKISLDSTVAKTASWFNTTIFTKSNFHPFKPLPIFKVKKAKILVGQVMNIYLNTGFLLKKLEELKDDKGNVNLFSFLENICSAVNETLGGLSSMAPSIDDTTNTLRIIEEGVLPNKNEILKELGIPTDSVVFNLYGYKGINTSSPTSNFVKSIKFQTQIDNSLATMISSGAQATSTPIKGVDATARFMSALKGLSDPEAKRKAIGDRKSVV
jgi:hypothetical protein